MAENEKTEEPTKEFTADEVMTLVTEAGDLGIKVLMALAKSSHGVVLVERVGDEVQIHDTVKYVRED